MKIEIDLPDYCDDGSAIRIFKGIELVAKKFQNKPWQIKIVRCNLCGKCCTLSVAGTKGLDSATGFCKELISGNKPGEKICALGSARPFSCCAYAAGEKEKDICCIEWKTLND